MDGGLLYDEEGGVPPCRRRARAWGREPRR
jgi:hypothetical protein